MTLFFLVVGLEAKRERDLGELREGRRLTVPVLAALAGMAASAAVYVALTAGAPGANTGGWGVAISTDTALALGALTIAAGDRADRLRKVGILATALLAPALAAAALAPLRRPDPAASVRRSFSVAATSPCPAR